MTPLLTRIDELIVNPSAVPLIDHYLEQLDQPLPGNC